MKMYLTLRVSVAGGKVMQEDEKVLNNVNVERLFLENPGLAQNMQMFKDVSQNFREMMMMYGCAIREVRTKLEVLNDEFQVKGDYNPIEYIKSRVKRPESIIEKLQRRGYPITMDSVYENLHDVAGIRVICGYVQDIYKIAELLISQDDVQMLQVKDYIRNPKPNGYRSLHLVVSIPVFFSDKTRTIKVEVQVRTIAMDFWASLEHQLKYKSEEDVSEDVALELKECADVIAGTDERMQKIFNELKTIPDEYKQPEDIDL